VNPNSRDTFGNTPLLCAAKGGYEEIVKLLLDRKEVNPGSRDNSGQTPLSCAASGGHEGIVCCSLTGKRSTPTREIMMAKLHSGVLPRVGMEEL